MAAPTLLRALDLVEAPGPGRPAHLSAASGLVRAGKFLYVVADDEHHLGMFAATGDGAGRLVRLFEGALPERKSERKKKKPDLEALVRLPPFGAFSHGALFALGSGSKRSRRRGVLLALDAAGAPRGRPRGVDLSKMYVALEELLPELNVEGAVVSGGELRLFQRGGKRDPNALVRYRLAEVLAALAPRARRSTPLPLAVHAVALPRIRGIPLCFTDGAALPGGDMAFAAVAEDRDGRYQDGECVGAAVGILSRNGKLRTLQRLNRPYKVEGLDAKAAGGAVRLLLVTDADDAGVPALLLSLRYTNPSRRGTRNPSASSGSGTMSSGTGSPSQIGKAEHASGMASKS